MSAEERVGQLFLVSFNGSSAGDETQIHDLITQHHIGGVILNRENDNFIEGENSIEAVYDLIYQLQTSEWKASIEPIVDPETGDVYRYQYIPLFVGISQPGGGHRKTKSCTAYPFYPIKWQSEQPGTATWQSKWEQSQEMNYPGWDFNLFLGPSLDVLESPESTLGNKLGAGVFGGDPFWVAKMGQAYIKGLHTGSEGRMIVIARNFPGKGSSDRPAGEEPATVRKSLEALKQIELAPFFAVTGNSPATIFPCRWTAGIPYPLPGISGKYPCHNSTRQFRFTGINPNPFPA